MTSIGITASREGISAQALETFESILQEFPELEELHHGDCVGGDEQIHMMMQNIAPEVQLIVHPPIKGDHRANCEGAHVVLPKKDYMVRNHDIVMASEAVIGFPNGNNEIMRSGTWATLRIARRKNKKIIVVYPDGTHGGF